MKVELISEEKLAAVVGREFEGVDADRKRVLVMSVRNAIDVAQLHQIFSENLSERELAFYRAIVIERPDGNDAGAAAPAQPPSPTPTPDAAATAATEGSRAAASKATAARDK